MAQLVKCGTLDLGSGHDLMVHRFEPCVGLHTSSAEPSWDSLPLLSLSLSRSHSLKVNKLVHMSYIYIYDNNWHIPCKIILPCLFILFFFATAVIL